jgi:uncharacterized protein
VSAIYQKKSESELLLHVRVTPKSGQDAVEGVETRADGRSRLKLRVRAAPEDGKANAAVERLLAGALRLPRRNVRVSGGHQSREKQVSVLGAAAAIEPLLAAFPCANKPARLVDIPTPNCERSASVNAS